MNNNFRFIIKTSTLWYSCTDDADDDTSTFTVRDTTYFSGTLTDTSTTTTFTVNLAPTFVVDLLDVFQSSSQTLESGVALCLDVDLESPSPSSNVAEQVGVAVRSNPVQIAVPSPRVLVVDS